MKTKVVVFYFVHEDHVHLYYVIGRPGHRMLKEVKHVVSIN